MPSKVITREFMRQDHQSDKVVLVSSMRITVTLDDDVAEAVRSLMRTSGKTFGQVLSQLARRGLTARNESGSRNGLPTFSVSANAPMIPSRRASALLADK